FQNPHPAKAASRAEMPHERLLWLALRLGVKDYFRKTGFHQALLGLSGGVDSALTACIAAAALGPANVMTIGLPSRYSSEGSISDGRALARRIGVNYEILSITALHQAAEQEMQACFSALGADHLSGITEENLQARLRGLVLMAISNQTGALLLTTGNKSEL